MNERKIVRNTVIKTLLVLFIFIIIGLLTFILAKAYIFSTLRTRALETAKNTNYAMDTYSVAPQQVNISRTYHKDGKYFCTQKNIQFDTYNTLTLYYDGEQHITTAQSFAENIAFVNTDPMIRQTIPTFADYIPDTFWFRFLSVFTTNISTETCNKIDCFSIDFGSGLKIWIAKDTGLVMREQNLNHIYTYSYKLNAVKDTDIKKPDLSEYRVIKSEEN